MFLSGVHNDCRPVACSSHAGAARAHECVLYELLSQVFGGHVITNECWGHTNSGQPLAQPARTVGLVFWVFFSLPFCEKKQRGKKKKSRAFPSRVLSASVVTHPIYTHPGGNLGTELNILGTELNIWAQNSTFGHRIQHSEVSFASLREESHSGQCFQQFAGLILRILCIFNVLGSPCARVCA